MRIIATEADGHWTAWTEDAPQDGYGGPTPQAAIVRLCDVIGRHPNGFRLNPRGSAPDRFVLDELRGEPCPDCRGSGRYVGLTAVEMCRTCAGSARA